MLPNKPPMSHWTDDQWTAIFRRDKNIIVSAGAGSGKTAVLTERVFQRIKEGVDVNQLLVVTFTKAAALEMKERIRLRIIKAIESGEESLFPQLNLLESAQISTFDSFSMAILKKYGYLLGIGQDIQIGDEIALKKLKDDLLDQFLNEKHQEASPDFIDLVKRYTMVDGRNLRTMISELTENILQRPDFEGIVTHDLEHYHTPDFYQSLISQVVKHAHQKLQNIQQILEIMHREFEIPEITEHIEKIKLTYEPLASYSDYDSLRTAIISHKIPQFRSYQFEEEELDIKEKLQTYKDKIKDIKDEIKALLYFDSATQIALMDENYPHEKSLLKITGDYIKKFFEYQITAKYFDFQTVAYYSIELIRKFPEVQNTLKENYKEILVDEYQDTSPLQDALIEGIANTNLFIVGDIKQSIYRFRGAEPKIFQKKYEDYQSNTNCEVIHLNANFRSRTEVIDDINHVFSMVFSEEYGGVDYRDDHQMNFGLTNYTEEAIFNQNYGMTFLKYDRDISEYMNGEWSNDNAKRQLASFEALLFIKDIIDKKKDFKIFDKENKTLRPARWDDFIILIDRKTYFDEFRDAFQAYGIPLHIHKSDAFLSNTDVLVTINLFKLLLSLSEKELCEKHFKHAFLSLAYSYLFDFKAEETLDFYTQIEHFDPESIFQQSQGTVFEAFFEVFRKLLKNQEYLRLQDILKEFNQSFNLLKHSLKLDNITAIEERLIYIFDQLKGFDQQDFILQDLVDYYAYAVSHHDPNNWFFNIDIDFVRGTAVVKDKVNIMTVHKSKGLEFPVVYYPNTFAGWIRNNDGVRFSDQHGLILQSVQEGFVDTLSIYMENIHTRTEALSERIRLLYVALTRSREAMVIAHPHENKLISSEYQYNPDKENIYEAIRSEYGSYKDIVQSFIDQFKYKIIEVDLDNIWFKSKTLRPTRENLLSENYEGELITYHVLTLPQSSSDKTTRDESMVFVHARDIEKKNVGIEIHEIFKYLDFTKNIADQLEHFKIPDSYKALILSFFDQPIMEDINQARIFKELPFAYETETEITRGIIDLVIEKDTHVIVIDYKTRDVHQDTYKDQVLRYVKYIYYKTKKPVSGYLYSLSNQNFTQVVESYSGLNE